jgi:glycine/D-amino acid oxidase-like deaminating enzyme
VTAPVAPRINGGVSFWWHELGGLPPPRPALAGDSSADVCIVGAGYTGLWAAWYLKAAAPELDVLVVEKAAAGFGASGRNGGWLTGNFAWPPERYLGAGGEAGVRALIRALEGTVDEVIRVAEAEGIDADIHRTDELMVAVTPAQLTRIVEEAAEKRHWAERVSLLSSAEVAARIRVAGALGALRIAGVARLQPAKLAAGLARAVEGRGVRIAEGTQVTRIAPGRVETDRGTVRAGAVLRCTEGFTTDLPGHRRDWLPLVSAQIVTEPLPERLWDAIGWEGRELLADGANSYVYCQRTREGRIALGGRGSAYRFGSRLDARGEVDRRTLDWLVGRLHRHFPMLRGVGIDHAWGGVIGVPRDWCATVGFDPASRIGWAGGYVGVGVSTANLAGRTLADLVLRRTSALTDLPWVNRRVRRWEPEPLRWLGVRGMYAALDAADRAEARGGAGWPGLVALTKRIAGR